MPAPTERISLNREQNAAILVGLNQLVNGYAGLRYRRSREILIPEITHKFQPRSFLDGETYQVILALRNRLAAAAEAKSSKHRWTCVQYAIAAFAVRVAGPPQKRSDADKALLRKLENFRKRAKRLTIKQMGLEVYADLASHWRRCLNWFRFEVLPINQTPPPRSRPLFRRMRREQFQTLVAFANEMISETCIQPLPQEDVERFVQLAIAEIRRSPSRHPEVNVRELVEDSSNAKAFLFRFIKKRVERGGRDLPLKFEYQSIDVQMSSRAKRMRAAMVIDSTPNPVQAAIPESVPLPVAHSSQQIPVTQISLSNPPGLTPQSVADWLNDNIDRSDWETVIEEAEYQLQYRSNRVPAFSRCTDIRKIQQQSRPEEQAADLPEFINLMVDWLLTWTLALTRDNGRLTSCYGQGLRIAKESYKAPLDTRSGGREALRYIGDVIDGIASA